MKAKSSHLSLQTHADGCAHKVSVDGDRDPLEPDFLSLTVAPAHGCRLLAPRGSSDLQGSSGENKLELKLKPTYCGNPQR